MSVDTSLPHTGRPGFGVLLLDKPVGPTSHDLVGWVRWALGVRQVGHCGTLDPLASGMMIVCVGSATRFVPFLTLVDKTYRATVALGRSTESADREGETVATATVEPTHISAAIAEVKAMTGELMLPPPAFSAIKVDGQRAHKLARKGKDVALEPRSMTVFSATDVISNPAEEPLIEWTCRVSKGTYIRSLAEELGRRVGVPAHLAGLRRLACAGFATSDPQTCGPIEATLLPPRPGRPPKYRCRLPGLNAGEERQQTRERLHQHLLDPVACLPLPKVACAAGDPGLTRLSRGQSCAVDRVTFGAALLSQVPPEEVEPVRVVVHGFEGSRRIAIVARLEDCGRKLSPEKVVREADLPTSR